MPDQPFPVAVVGPPPLPSGIVPYVFGTDNLGASASAEQLYRVYPGSAGTFAQTGVHPLFRGFILGMELNANTAKTAGTANFEVYVTPVAGAAAASGAKLSWEDSFDYATTSFRPGLYEFTAGSELDVRVTTNAAFTPTTVDLELILHIAQTTTEATPV